MKELEQLSTTNADLHKDCRLLVKISERYSNSGRGGIPAFALFRSRVARKTFLNENFYAAINSVKSKSELSRRFFRLFDHFWLPKVMDAPCVSEMN